MGKVNDITGQRFGRLVAQRFVGIEKRLAVWEFRCDCGHVISYYASLVMRGRTRSCGCLRRDMSRQSLTTHGLSKTAEYEIWQGMWKRCTNQNEPGFKNWGGRGIRVAVEWKDFTKFLAHIGPRPSKQHSIERIDNDGNYEPGNVRWATRIEQSRNRRKRVITWVWNKGRPGEQNGRAKLNDQAVMVIRFLAAKGVSRYRLAMAHDVCLSSINRAVTGSGWRHLQPST